MLDSHITNASHSTPNSIACLQLLAAGAAGGRRARPVSAPPWPAGGAAAGGRTGPGKGRAWGAGRSGARRSGGRPGWASRITR